MEQIKKQPVGSNENGLKRRIMKDPDIYLVLAILLFHGLCFATVLHFYGVMGINGFTWFYPVILFSIAAFPALVNKGYLRGIVLTSVASFMLILFSMGPFAIYASMVTVYPILILIGIIVAGIGVGKFIRLKFPLAIFKILKFGMILFSSAYLLMIGSIATGLDDCESFEGSSKESCYEQKAHRQNDENICGNIESWSDRDMCYESVIFDYKEKNYKTTDQCNGITDNVARQRCYIDFAEEKTDKSVCDSLIEDAELIKDCHERVEKGFCYKVPKGTGIENFCDKSLRNLEGKNLDDVLRTDTADIEKNRSACLYKEYKAIVQEEKERGDSSSSRSKRFTDINRIKYLADETRDEAKSCDEKSATIESGHPPKYMCGRPEYWPSMDVCGEQINDAQWHVTYKDGDWDYTIECKNYPECSGIENVKCTKDKCIFSEKCSESDGTFQCSTEYIPDNNRESIEKFSGAGGNVQTSNENIELWNRQQEYQRILSEENAIGDTTHERSKRFSNIDVLKRVAERMAKQGKECEESGGVIKSSKDGKGLVCPGYDSMNWSNLSACGNAQSDYEWVVVYKDGDWDYTIECKNYPECSGIENVKCTKDGCIFSDKCTEY